MTYSKTTTADDRRVYELGSDSRVLRNALGCFATGVCVLTAMSKDGVPVGLTLNSFTSVSLEPPLVLACIARTVSSLSTIEASDHFAINVLQSNQQDVSTIFATRVEDRFSKVTWTAGTNGTPIISDALASVECSRHAVHDGGDHIILVAHVDRANFDPGQKPLLYFRGNYRNLDVKPAESED